jgi:hypothetical protein
MMWWWGGGNVAMRRVGCDSVIVLHKPELGQVKVSLNSLPEKNML